MIAFLLSLLAAVMTQPTTTRAALPAGVDYVVAQDGSTKYRTIASALAAAEGEHRGRVVILVRDGVYNEHLAIKRSCVTLRGESRERTRIELSLPTGQWLNNPDDIGRGVVNVYGDDVILERLTVANTQSVRTHAFALYGRGTRTLTQDCDFLSEGNDTVGLWAPGGGLYYHARCHFRGQVDYLCPRGWCFVRDSTFFEVTDKATLWHDGEKDPRKKLVIVNSRFDGAQPFSLGRYPRDSQFYLVGCAFAAKVSDVRDDDVGNPAVDLHWGRRVYFSSSTHDGGATWSADNLTTAAGAPKAADITPAWTFGGAWDPERTDAPTIVEARLEGPERVVALRFSEAVTVRGQPVLITKLGERLPWTGENGRDTLRFATLDANDRPIALDLAGGAVEASLATTTTRPAAVELPEYK